MNYLEVFGTLVGLAYLWLEYKASIYLWIASIIMPAIYIIVYYQAGLYADFGINIYYLIASVYGWIIWKSNKARLIIYHKIQFPACQNPDGILLWVSLHYFLPPLPGYLSALQTVMYPIGIVLQQL